MSAKLGSPDALPSVETVQLTIAADIAPKLTGFIREAKAIAARALKPLEDERLAMTEKHQAERERLDAGQRQRRLMETRERAARLRGGLAGWLTGAHARTVKRNELEAVLSLQRDREQRDDLVIAQMKERRALQERIRAVRRQHAERLLALYQESARMRQMAQARDPSLRSKFRDRSAGGRSPADGPRSSSPRRGQAWLAGRTGPGSETGGAGAVDALNQSVSSRDPLALLFARRQLSWPPHCLICLVAEDEAVASLGMFPCDGQPRGISMAKKLTMTTRDELLASLRDQSAPRRMRRHRSNPIM